jgi:hypothetical protein
MLPQSMPDQRPSGRRLLWTIYSRLKHKVCTTPRQNRCTTGAERCRRSQLANVAGRAQMVSDASRRPQESVP